MLQKRGREREGGAQRPVSFKTAAQQQTYSRNIHTESAARTVIFNLKLVVSDIFGYESVTVTVLSSDITATHAQLELALFAEDVYECVAALRVDVGSESSLNLLERMLGF